MASRRTAPVPLGAALEAGPGDLRARDDVPPLGRRRREYVAEDQSGVIVTAYGEIVSGNLTHLGRVTGEAEVNRMRIQPEPAPIHVPLGASIVPVAADEDELGLEHTPDDWDPDTQTANSTCEITGGTERFADATGDGTTAGSGHDTVENTWNGAIEHRKS